MSAFTFAPFAASLVRPAKSLCAMLAVLAIAGGCVPSRPPPPPPVAAAPQQVLPPQTVPRHPLTGDQPGFVRLSNIPESHVPVRVGMLLPFTNGSPSTRALAASMLKAAELALFDAHNPDLLIVSADEGSTPEQAAAGARSLIAQGAEIIIGPLFSQSTKAAAPVARDHAVPLISFSTDRSVGGDGVYLLSFQAENEARRIVSFAASQHHVNFAALVPDNSYGARVAEAFADEVRIVGGHVTEVAKFSLGGGDIAGAAQAVGKTRPDAILIAQGGNLLRDIALALNTNGAGNRNVQLLGTGLWDDPALAKEATLAGGWFTAPAHESHRQFEARYHSQFGSNPPQLATLAFDAMLLVARLSSGQPYHRFTEAALTDPNGFAGVDGIFRFEPDGSSQRGLSILSVQPEGFEIVNHAPTTFQGS